MTETIDTELLPDVQTTEPGDHDKFSHYVRKDDIVEATVNGTPIMALCGKVWVPTRDGERYVVCPECKDIYDTVLHD